MEHKLINNGQYLLVVSDDEIKENNYVADFRLDGRILISKWNEEDDEDGFFYVAKKIIAHLPLNNSPILQGVDILPLIEEEDNVWKHGLEEELNRLPYTKHLDDGQYNDGQIAGFEFGANWGFEKAKEKYKYTKEDIEKAYCAGMNFIVENKGSYEDFIQSLSQPKLPVAFETEDLDVEIIKNSQGQTVWVGEYIYN